METLIDFESTLRVGNPDGYMEATGRERQNNVRYHREGDTQIVSIPLHGAHFTQNVTDIDYQTVRLEWTAKADETLDEGAYFCLSFSGDNYSDALFSIKGKEGEGTTVFITLMPSLRKGRKAELSAVMKTGHISLEE